MFSCIKRKNVSCSPLSNTRHPQKCVFTSTVCHLSYLTIASVKYITVLCTVHIMISVVVYDDWKSSVMKDIDDWKLVGWLKSTFSPIYPRNHIGSKCSCVGSQKVIASGWSVKRWSTAFYVLLCNIISLKIYQNRLRVSRSRIWFTFMLWFIEPPSVRTKTENERDRRKEKSVSLPPSTIAGIVLGVLACTAIVLVIAYKKYTKRWDVSLS